MDNQRTSVNLELVVGSREDAEMNIHQVISNTGKETSNLKDQETKAREREEDNQWTKRRRRTNKEERKAVTKEEIEEGTDK